MIRTMLVKEFLLVFRDRHALAALFIMPAIFILIMSLALKDAFTQERAVITYAIIDEDHTPQSEQLLSYFERNALLNEQNLTAQSPEALSAALNTGTHFIVTVPKGFGRQFTSKSGRATPLEIDVASDVTQNLLSLFKSQATAAFMQVRLEAIKETLEKRSRSAAKELEVISFEEADMMKVAYRTMSGADRPTSTQQSVPSWIVFGIFFVIIPMSTIFINERKQNTLMRLSAMNVSVSALLIGKIAPYMVINQLQVWTMIAVGMFAVPLFGADALTLGNSLGGLLMVSLGLSLSAIGVSMLIAVLVDSVEQATTIGGIINILFGAIGGIMVPKFVMPDFMQSFSNISPMSWGLEGFLDIFLRGLGAEAVIYETAALAGFGLIALGIAALILHNQLRRGL